MIAEGVINRMASLKVKRSRLSLWFSLIVVTVAFFNLYIGSFFALPQIEPLPNDSPQTRVDKNRKQDKDIVAVLAEPPPARTPTNEACQGGFDGIYHMRMGDIGGAAGTIFFQFAIGQLVYAERNNLKPWIYLDGSSDVIYDPVVHGGGPGVSLTALVGRNATIVRRPNGHMKDVQPGPPDTKTPVRSEELHFSGTGVWEHYFEPVSDFVPGDSSCATKPYITMGLWNLHLITPGIHGFVDWAPKCWRYKYLPDYVTKPHQPLTEWLEPQRKMAHSVIKRYIHFRPEIRIAANEVNPGCSAENPCLGLHIRHSDKAAGRRVVQTEEFLPYAKAFVHSGGKVIYLATDSQKVLEEINEQWPKPVTDRIRTMGNNVVRSTDDTAVFDIGSHHRTNVEIFIEILALSQCQYMIHGLSAVSESSIWINLDLHLRSVNLEDPERITAAAFGTLVQMELRGEYEERFPRPLRTNEWWSRIKEPEGTPKPTNEACEGYDGVLRIASVAKDAGTGKAFFTSVLNQLIYAEMYNLKPWIHLKDSASIIYDPRVHNEEAYTTFEMLHGMAGTAVRDKEDVTVIFPGKPALRTKELVPRAFRVKGNGIWNSYFEPVSDFVPGDLSCRSKPLIELDPQLVEPGIDLHADWAIRAWQYDGIPATKWNPSGETLEDYYEILRKKAQAIVKKYFRPKPYIIERAAFVNPVKESKPCLGVHMRNIDRTGKHRKGTPIEPEMYVSYMIAFLRAGGHSIYLATDSRSALQHIFKEYPELSKRIKTQGEYTVRSFKKKRKAAKEWPPHFLDEHHRVNSEALVDVVALSKCSFLIHSFSTLSEAAIYFNPSLHNSSINLEIPKVTPDVFEHVVNEHLRGLPGPENGVPTVPTRTIDINSIKVDNATIIGRTDFKSCRRNAIVYLAQKVHSSYGRDSYASLLRSLSLLTTNYLSLENQGNNTDLFIFHTGDFDQNDLLQLEKQLGASFKGVLYLVDLQESPFWARPQHQLADDPKDWYAWPLFSEGYRRMMHWFAIDIWEFFERFNSISSCSYRYIWRLDEDSFIHSPIQNDLFEVMRSKDYAYGYRMCAYEMKVSRRMWTWWSKRHKNFSPYRDLDLDMCGFYNNFFVADLEFFRSPEVAMFLRFIDKMGHIYRKRLGDLMIHSMVAYAFAPPERIHRFLDFTYEHSTLNKTSGCLIWGGIQAGANDSNAASVMDEFYGKYALDLNCPVNASYLGADDLSPLYSHLSPLEKAQISLHTITAGSVELPSGKGPLSG